MTDYKYLIFDGSVYLMKAFNALKPKYFDELPTTYSDGRPVLDENQNQVTHYQYTFDTHDITKVVYWMLAKFIREGYSCCKPIVLFDKSPYHKITLLSDYKGDRYYATQEELDELNYDDDPKAYLELEQEVRANDMKQEAKHWMIENFPKLGFDMIYHAGYEADDLAHLIADQLKDDDQKSGLVSVDSDWAYLINENIDFLKLNGDCIDYGMMLSEMQDDLPKELWDKVDLYWYKAYTDALAGSHNNMECTIKDIPEGDYHKALIDIYNNGTEYLSNVELFRAQLKAFDVYHYPEIDQVLSKLKDIGRVNELLSVDQLEYMKMIDGFKVSASYYSRTIDLLDIRYFSKSS